MTPTQKEIASVEEFEKTLTFEHPIPVSWAIRKYKAQHELKEQLKEENQQLADKYNDMMYGLEAQLMRKDAEIEQFKDQRNRALVEWGKTLDDGEVLVAQLGGEQNLIRPEVLRFAQQMESTLKQNDHKGGWGPDKCSMNYLLERLREEVIELSNATGFSGPEAKERIISECTDVANFSMMIADRISLQLKEQK